MAGVFRSRPRPPARPAALATLTVAAPAAASSLVFIRAATRAAQRAQAVTRQRRLWRLPPTRPALAVLTKAPAGGAATSLVFMAAATRGHAVLRHRRRRGPFLRHLAPRRFAFAGQPLGRNWRPYRDGTTYPFRAMQQRITIAPASLSAWVRIETERLVLDVPDVEHQVFDVAIGAGGTTITFSDYGIEYVTPPFISVTHKGGAVNKAHVITNLTTKGFDIVLRDKTDALVTGTVDLFFDGF